MSVLAGLALAGPAMAATAVRRWRGVALGAEAELELRGPDAATGPALTAALEEVARMEGLFSLYRDSALTRLNRDGVLSVPDPAFADLMALCDRVHGLTGGLFDPTVQPLWLALAEGGDVTAARARVGWDRVRRDGGAVRLGAGQALTLNGIAQGFAADRVAAVLRGHGLSDVAVDLGERVVVGPARRLGLVDPDAGLVGMVTVRDGAVATSSPGATLASAGGHILHPAGGVPLWSSVCIEAEHAALADGLSTAGCLMDGAGLTRIAGLPGVRRVVAVDADGDVSRW